MKRDRARRPRSPGFALVRSDVGSKWAGCRHALSPKPRQDPKISAPNGRRISLTAPGPWPLFLQTILAIAAWSNINRKHGNTETFWRAKEGKPETGNKCRLQTLAAQHCNLLPVTMVFMQQAFNRQSAHQWPLQSMRLLFLQSGRGDCFDPPRLRAVTHLAAKMLVAKKIRRDSGCAGPGLMSRLHLAQFERA